MSFSFKRVTKKGQLDQVRSLDPTATTLKSDDFTDYVMKVLKHYDIKTNEEMLDIYIFTFITMATIIITVIRSFLFFNVAMKASINLHNAMFRGITRAAMYFFHTNPSGRILNRFSKDMGQVDEILPTVMIDVIQIFLSLLGIVIVIVFVNPLFLLPTALLAILFYNLRTFYLKTSRDIKRLEAISNYFKINYNLLILFNNIELSNFSAITNIFPYGCITNWAVYNTFIWRSTSTHH